MPVKIDFTFEQGNNSRRLDSAFADYCSKNGIELTRSSIKARNLVIFVNEKPEKPSYVVKIGDRIHLELPEIEPAGLIPQDLDFEIVYSDNDIAVINKPYGLTVHPSKGHPDKTLVNGLLYRLKCIEGTGFGKPRLSSIGGEERPGIVHRLDKDTAGLMVVALNDKAHHGLADDFKARRIKKTYHAIVKGRVDQSGRIEAPIGRSKHDRKKMAVTTGGKPAVTEYRVIEYLNGHSYIEINLLTGRTHQIRVHFSHIGHTVAGDPVYSRNAKSYGLTGIALCAKKLEFIHPVLEKPMLFEINLPEEFKELLEKLRNG